MSYKLIIRIKYVVYWSEYMVLLLFFVNFISKLSIVHIRYSNYHKLVLKYPPEEKLMTSACGVPFYQALVWSIHDGWDTKDHSWFEAVNVSVILTQVNLFLWIFLWKKFHLPTPSPQPPTNLSCPQHVAYPYIKPWYDLYMMDETGKIVLDFRHAANVSAILTQVDSFLWVFL